MSRKLSVERTFALRQYENIKLFDEIEIPEGKELNANIVDKLRMLQFLQLELHFRHYVDLMKKANTLSLEEQIGLIEEMKLNILQELNGEKENG